MVQSDHVTWADSNNIEKAFEKAIGGKMHKVGNSHVVGIRGVKNSDFRIGFMDRAFASSALLSASC
ncbi:hypothetical protein [Candidatus Liberibacter sp.]|uniref:hypothetical protein n=1 Tax=Candidatus Liberibacter sp. TaxID=34022 RepID=UPI0015F52FAE|nr:hypothetical protein [Candidatus Liberibacter sp.]MBA5724428.1 hypothetical protein [Candidatus Liberibacter sp.]